MLFISLKGVVRLKAAPQSLSMTLSKRILH